MKSMMNKGMMMAMMVMMVMMGVMNRGMKNTLRKMKMKTRGAGGELPRKTQGGKLPKSAI